MKTLNVKISPEAYKILSNFKTDKNLRTLGEAVDKYVLRAFKDSQILNGDFSPTKLKGGIRK